MLSKITQRLIMESYSHMRSLNSKVRVIWLVAFGSTIFLPIFVNQTFAYGLPEPRSVKISSSTAGATGVTYVFSIKTATAGVIEGLVFNFCDDTPIIGNSCGWTSGQSASIGSAAISSVTGTPDTTIGASNWKINANANSASAGNGVILAIGDANASENSSIAANTPLTFTITGITNPNYTTCAGTQPNCSFYMRMLTYTTSAGATGYASQTIGAPTDAGGAALSTAAVINISATVMETLTFCVSGATITGTCGSLTTPTLVIGHGSPTATINSSATDVSSAYTQISTNALTGASVTMKSNNSSCSNGGLSANGGTSCGISGVNAGNGTHLAMPAGTAAFGLCVNKGGSATIDTTYNDTVNSCPTTWNATSLYGMNGTNVTSTYGDQIFTETAPVNADPNRLTFAATASNLTPAGIYTVSEQLIATGTF
jgi:hypothetical protein